MIFTQSFGERARHKSAQWTLSRELRENDAFDSLETFC